MITALIDELILVFIALLVWLAVPNNEVVNAIVIFGLVYAGVVIYHKIKKNRD